MTIALIVHGGAGQIPEKFLEGFRAGCARAARAGWEVLSGEGSALDAVEAAVRVLEDDPHFEAGFGASLSRDGEITLDAGIMDGSTLDVGSIAHVPLIRNPISLARQVLQSPHAFLQGEGAVHFAAEHGIEQCRLVDMITSYQLEEWQSGYKNVYDETGHQLPGSRSDTVGAVALDMQGRLAAATSTSGLSNKHRGRVGDSPLIGCGFYADEQGAGSATGHGEDFMRTMLLHRAINHMHEHQEPLQAARYAIEYLEKSIQGAGGMILLDRQGKIGLAHNTPYMAYAWMREGMHEPIAGIRLE